MRGKIRNKDFALQVNDFQNLRWNKITPTDIDGLIDFQNKAWVIIEMKHIGNDMPFGQQLAIERLTDDLAKTGKPAIAIVGEHETIEDIDVGNCFVSKYRSGGIWRELKTQITIKKLIDYFLMDKGIL